IGQTELAHPRESTAHESMPAVHRPAPVLRSHHERRGGKHRCHPGRNKASLHHLCHCHVPSSVYAALVRRTTSLDGGDRTPMRQNCDTSVTALPPGTARLD